MRTPITLLVLATIACGAIATTAPARAGNGTVTTLTVSPNPKVAAGTSMGFEVSGTGSGAAACDVSIAGLPGYPAPENLQVSGSLARRIVTKRIVFTEPGTYALTAKGTGTCDGSATATVVVSEVPTIEKLEYLPVASPARPDPAMIYANDPLQLNVIMNSVGNGSASPVYAGCDYAIDMKLVKGERDALPSVHVLGDASGAYGMGPAPGPGLYDVTVKGEQIQSDSILPPCKGEATIPMYFWPQRAFINGLELRGHGQRVGNNDETELTVIPNFGGKDPGGSCAYHIAYAVRGTTTQYDEVYHDGGSGAPLGKIPSIDDNGVKYDVTISQLADGLPGLTPCQVWPKGTIAKTITFGANPILPGVVVK